MMWITSLFRKLKYAIDSITAHQGGTWSVNQNGEWKFKYDGNTYTGKHKDVQYTTTQTRTDIWVPSSGKKFVLTDLTVSVDTEMTVTLLDEGTVIYEWYFKAGGGDEKQFKTPYVSSGVEYALEFSTSTNGKISISSEGYEI